eukprot:Rmarinus@m.5972
MTCLFVFVGQCGCQLGAQFWSLVLSELVSVKSSFLDPSGRCRCVFVDSEPKVLTAVLRDTKGISGVRFRDVVREENVHVAQAGCGNNWAMGYSGQGYGVVSSNSKSSSDEPPSLYANAMESIRLEVERAGWLSGIIVIHSISGGTGAGLGSRLLEGLRFTYPRHYIMSVSVAPFHQSDTILGPYNATLALAASQTYADAVLMLQNEDILGALGGPQVSIRPGRSSPSLVFAATQSSEAAASHTHLQSQGQGGSNQAFASGNGTST